MQEVVYFSIWRDFASEHPDIGGSWHYVGSAIVIDHEDGDPFEVEIQRLYMAADPQANCHPSSYMEADPNNVKFSASRARTEIDAHCIDLPMLNHKPQNSADAEAICRYFEEREKAAKEQGITISVAEMESRKNNRTC